MSRKRGSEERGTPELENPMLERADGTEMCNSVISVILKSMGVASAKGEVAELFCRDRLGGAAVDMGFERGLVLDQVTDWVMGNADQQRLHTAEQRVSPARDQQSVATSVEVDQERLCVAKKQVLAASSTREASVASG